MDITPPWLEIIDPDGRHMGNVQLTKDRTTIGRYPSPFNDISLADPHQYVTREIHCFIECQGSHYYIVSNGKNATLVRVGTSLCPVQGKSLLANHDTICILGRPPEHKQPYWELVFHDPEETRTASSVPYLEYEEDHHQLFKVEGRVHHRVSLRKQEDSLIRYMWMCNRQNYNTPVLIPISELKRAVWEEDEEKVPHASEEVHKLIASLRAKIELNPKRPQFLLNERGLGYLLHTHPLPSIKQDVPERVDLDH